MKRLNLLSILTFLMLINTFVVQGNNNLKTRKLQVTFAYPIGSNGISSMEYSNNFSFNMLYGLNGGLNGAEIGSVLNYNKEGVKGFQLSGISNICKDSTKGVFISGVLNYSKRKSEGFQLSGISNICKDSTKGVFISGVLNYSKRKSESFQLSGVSNIYKDSTKGVFISGVLNYSKKKSEGFQLATTNIAVNEFNGFQLGLFNYARKLKGVQFGVFNYLNDGEKALPIGLFNIVKNGHYEVELTGGEVIYSNLNYKMGIERFYTIFKAGCSSYKNNPVYSQGLGFGGNIHISEKQKISIDLSANQVVYNNEWDSNLNMLNKADFNYKYSVSERFSLLIGTSFNIYVTKQKVDGEYGTLDIPYSIYTNEWSGGKLFMWFGLNAGLALKL